MNLLCRLLGVSYITVINCLCGKQQHSVEVSLVGPPPTGYDGKIRQICVIFRHFPSFSVIFRHFPTCAFRRNVSPQPVGPSLFYFQKGIFQCPIKFLDVLICIHFYLIKNYFIRNLYHSVRHPKVSILSKTKNSPS